MEHLWIRASEGLLSEKESSIEDYCIERLSPYLSECFGKAIYQYQNATQTQDVLANASCKPLHLWVHANIDVVFLDALSSLNHKNIQFSFSNQRSLAEARRVNKESATHWLSQALERASIVPFPVDETIHSSDFAKRIDLLLGLFSGVGVEHHVHKVLEAVSQANCGWKIHWMVQQTELAQAEALVREYPEVEVFIESPWSVDRYVEISKEIAACAHLLFSASEPFSPCIPISLMQGLEVLVLNFSEGEMLPNAVVKKILPGIDEVAMMVSWLKDFNKEFSIQARTYATELHAAQMVASNLSLELRR